MEMPGEYSNTFGFVIATAKTISRLWFSTTGLHLGLANLRGCPQRVRAKIHFL